MAQPEYLRIAADLRRRISSGEFGPGDQLPTLPALCEEYRVSDITICNAMRLLSNEGLIETRARAGTRVRPRPPVHRMAADRYRTTPSYVRWSNVAGTPVSEPVNEPWLGGTRAQMVSLGISVNRVTESFTAAMPTDLEARTLRIGAGVPVLRYTRRHIADTGRIVEVAHPIVRRGDTTVVDFVIDLDE
ncbi:GntR family transcriptional regulator [Streptomyces sp. NPDC059743]|uniref:GntR family transcriptional regulator n=1 Tax=Streptomyces sp. NPDC059743 TaxID=3346928 RepID=UPI00365548A6